MIRIDRGPVPVSVRAFSVADVKDDQGVLVTRAQREYDRAEAFFTNVDHFANNVKKTKAGFDFAIYKDPELAQELDRVFGTKCAYCESNFGAVTPDDVEHFRPKSEIDTGSGELAPGYYWLAGEWTNLLVSCPDCNRGRNFEVPGQQAAIKLGKSTQFPLADEQMRFRGPGPGTGDEEPQRLLIDPCSEEPADHLTFDDQALILPKRDAADVPSEKGETSILVYALQRKGLVEARLEKLDAFRFQVRQLQRTVRRVNRLKVTGDDVELADALDEVRDIKQQLKRMLAPRSEYLGMLRDWIRREKADGAFPELDQFNLDLEQLD